jgi:hypothetical protein
MHFLLKLNIFLLQNKLYSWGGQPYWAFHFSEFPGLSFELSAWVLFVAWATFSYESKTWAVFSILDVAEYKLIIEISTLELAACKPLNWLCCVANGLA